MLFNSFQMRSINNHFLSYALQDRIHMLLRLPPKYGIAMLIGYSKSKSGICIHAHLLNLKGALFGRSFWARGYCVSTAGFDDHLVNPYIENKSN
jgi:putative transposase